MVPVATAITVKRVSHLASITFPVVIYPLRRYVPALPLPLSTLANSLRSVVGIIQNERLRPDNRIPTGLCPR